MVAPNVLFSISGSVPIPKRRVSEIPECPFAMLLQSLVSGALFAGLAVAQTPPGFAPEVKDRLDLIFGTKVVTVPGTSLTKAGECCF